MYVRVSRQRMRVLKTKIRNGKRNHFTRETTRRADTTVYFNLLTDDVDTRLTMPSRPFPFLPPPPLHTFDNSREFFLLLVTLLSSYPYSIKPPLPFLLAYSSRIIRVCPAVSAAYLSLLGATPPYRALHETMHCIPNNSCRPHLHVNTLPCMHSQRLNIAG